MTTPDTTPSIRVVVAHHDSYVCAGIVALLRSCPGLAVRTGRADDTSADVLVTDYATGLHMVMAAARNSTEAMPSFLVVTDQSTGWQIRRAVDAGIRGYVLQDCSADELAGAVRCVAEGRRYMSISAAEHLLESLDYAALTARELEVLEFVAHGASNKEIARSLGIGEGTVKTHVTSILAKLEEPTRTAAIAEALRRGILLQGHDHAPLPAPALGPIKAASAASAPRIAGLAVRICHEDAVVQAGLVALVEREPDIDVHAGANHEGDAADVIVADYAYALSLLAATATPETSAQSSPRVIIVTRRDKEGQVVQAIHSGVQGYLLQDASPLELIDAIRYVARGGTRFLSSRAAGLLVQDPLRAGFTAREEDVLRFLVKGDCNKGIARKLQISASTVKSHVSRICEKLHVNSRAQVAVKVTQRGLMRA